MVQPAEVCSDVGSRVAITVQDSFAFGILASSLGLKLSPLHSCTHELE